MSSKPNWQTVRLIKRHTQAVSSWMEISYEQLFKTILTITKLYIICTYIDILLNQLGNDKLAPIRDDFKRLTSLTSRPNIPQASFFQ